MGRGKTSFTKGKAIDRRRRREGGRELLKMIHLSWGICQGEGGEV